MLHYKKLVIILTTLLISAGFLHAVAYIITRPAHASVGQLPANGDWENVSFPSRSGSTIRGWYSAARSEKASIVLMHGVRSNRRSMLARSLFLKRSGYSVLIFDFQAHGESGGSRITFGHLESLDAQAAIEFVKHCSPTLPVGVIGVSLGGAAAILSEPPLDIDALVLESVYSTSEAALTNRLAIRFGEGSKILAPIFLALLHPELGIKPSDLRPIGRIASVRSPVLIISGTVDTRTTIAESQALFAAAKEPKEFWSIPNASHVDLYAFDRDTYENRILAFLRKYLVPQVQRHTASN